MNPSSGRSDVTQVFSGVMAWLTIGVGLLVLGFIYFLGGWAGWNAMLNWAGEGDNAFLYIGGPPFFFLLGLFLLLMGFHEFKEYNLIRNTPTSKIRSAAVGRVEVKGTARPLSKDELLEAPFSGEPCLIYRCEIEEYEHDDDGGDWHTIYSNRQSPPFKVRDKTGELVVDATGAEWSLGGSDYREEFKESETSERIQTFMDEKVNESDFLDVDLMGGELRRFTENRLHPEEDLYVMGDATPCDKYDGCALLIEDGGTAGLFYLSENSEKEIVSTKRTNILMMLGSGLVLTPLSAVILCHFLGIL